MNNQVQESSELQQQSHPIKQLVSKPALRLVSTKGMTRETWLNIRKKGIGSSDAAAAVGLNPYQSPLELWLVKTGRDELLPKIEPDDEGSPMYWGSILEPFVAEHYTKHSGHKVRRLNAVLQHPDEDKDWMLANLDYSVVGQEDVQILECKTAGEYGAKAWREGVPEYVQCQVQHQLAVTGKAAADVCVLICGQEIKIHRIERDAALIEELIKLERQFWQYVIDDTPPPVDGSDSSALALSCLYPKDNEEVIDASDNEELSNQFMELVSLKSHISNLTKQESKLKQSIQAFMGEASSITFPQGQVSFKRSKDSTGMDIKALLKAQPKLLMQFPKVKTGSRRFLIKTND